MPLPLAIPTTVPTRPPPRSARAMAPFGEGVGGPYGVGGVGQGLRVGSGQTGDERRHGPDEAVDRHGLTDHPGGGEVHLVGVATEGLGHGRGHWMRSPWRRAAR